MLSYVNQDFFEIIWPSTGTLTYYATIRGFPIVPNLLDSLTMSSCFPSWYVSFAFRIPHPQQ